MKRSLGSFVIPLIAAAVLVGSISVGHAVEFGWTISASDTDPNVNTGLSTNGVRTLYLWLQCGTGNGLAGAEFDLCATGIIPLAFTAAPTFWCSDSPPESILLCAQGCPTGPVVAGSILVLDLVGSICLCPDPNGNNLSVECGTLEGVTNRHRGCSNVGAPCETGPEINLCDGPPVERDGWGSIKSRYR